LTKKFIEEQFPIVELSIIGRKEKSSRFDNISGIHVWWARRPTTIARGLILASLIDYPSNKVERRKITNLLINACSDYKKLPNQFSIKGEIQKYINKAYPNSRPILLDTFSGGGAIPLEAARIGLVSYGIDLNPIAVLIGKATCELFQKYDGKLVEEIHKWWKNLKKKLEDNLKIYYTNPVNKNPILSFTINEQPHNKPSIILLPVGSIHSGNAITNCAFLSQSANSF